MYFILIGIMMRRNVFRINAIGLKDENFVVHEYLIGFFIEAQGFLIDKKK